MRKKWKINNVEELVFYIEEVSNYFKNKCNWNLDNKVFLNKILKELPEKEMSITKLDILLKSTPTNFSNKKRSSTISLNYWKTIGWKNEKEIKKKISLEQKKRSKICLEYWLNKGLSLEKAKKELHDYQSKNSKIAWEDSTKMKINNPIFKEYWVNKGYSINESKKIINPSNREYYRYKSDSDYEKYKLRASERVKTLWEKGIYDENHLLYRTRYTSKEEKIFFDYIIKENIYDNIKYEPFGINVRKSKLNKYFLVYDGYIKTENGIILLEYDGTYWHNIKEDDFKDYEVLKIRKDIIGIIRITDTYFKNNKLNINKIKKDIKDGINKIKSKKCKTIRY